jgi:hypothetical protein
MAELTKRYLVMPLATEAVFDLTDPDGAFVLKPWKDPAALRALATYRDNCYPELARDLGAWISAIKAGPLVRGDVGTRNEPHLKVDHPAASTGAKPRLKAKVKPKSKAPKKKPLKKKVSKKKARPAKKGGRRR